MTKRCLGQWQREEPPFLNKPCSIWYGRSFSHYPYWRARNPASLAIILMRKLVTIVLMRNHYSSSFEEKQTDPACGDWADWNKAKDKGNSSSTKAIYSVSPQDQAGDRYHQSIKEERRIKGGVFQEGSKILWWRRCKERSLPRRRIWVLCNSILPIESCKPRGAIGKDTQKKLPGTVGSTTAVLCDLFEFIKLLEFVLCRHACTHA